MPPALQVEVRCFRGICAAYGYEISMRPGEERDAELRRAQWDKRDRVQPRDTCGRNWRRRRFDGPTTPGGVERPPARVIRKSGPR